MQVLRHSTAGAPRATYLPNVRSQRRNTLRLPAVLAFVLIMGLFATAYVPRAAAQTGTLCPGEQFSDVCPADWYYSDVTNLASVSAIGGYSDGTFRPGNQITRGQLTKVIVIAGGLSASPPATATYVDVPPTNPSFAWIEAAAANHIVGGYTCGGANEPCDAYHRPYFRPGENTNRGQMAKIISNAFGLASGSGNSTSFADVPVSSPYSAYVGAVYSLGIANGYNCGAANEPCASGQNQLYFRPNATTTRAQASKMVNIARVSRPHATATRAAQTATPVIPPSFTPTLLPAPTNTLSAPTGTPTALPAQTAPPATTTQPSATPVGTAPATSTTSQSTATTVPTSSPTQPPPTSTVIPSATPSRTASPTSSPPSTPSSTPWPTSTSTPASHMYGLIGQGGLGEPVDMTQLQQQYDAGVRLRLLQLGWDVLQPNGPSTWSAGTASAFQQRIDAFVANNPDVQIVLDLGVQYPPSWAAQVDPLVDQYGTVWQAHFPDGGVNVYWSSTVRQYVADYIRLIFTNLNFRGRLWSVRVGPYQGELLYPHQANTGRNLSFWAFDSRAQSQNPVPGWVPGQPSPNGEAQRFYYWYVDNLVNTFNFFHTEIRRYFAGYVAPVTPGMGVVDTSAAQLISRNLSDISLNYYGTGNYWQRVFGMLPGASAGVLNWCSSVGDLSGNDNSQNWRDWSSGKMMAYLAHQNGREIYGENPGHNAFDSSGGADPRTTMQADFATMQNSGYLGLLWLSQSDLTDPACASLAQYHSMIIQHP